MSVCAGSVFGAMCVCSVSGAVCLGPCVCMQCVWGRVCECACSVWGPAGGLRKRLLLLGHPPVSADRGLCPSGAFSSGPLSLCTGAPLSAFTPVLPSHWGPTASPSGPSLTPPGLAQAPDPLPASGLLLPPSSSTAPQDTPPLGTSSDVTSSVRPSWVSRGRRAGPSCRAFPTYLIKSQPWVWSHRLLAAGEEAGTTALQGSGWVFSRKARVKGWPAWRGARTGVDGRGLCVAD